MRQAKAMSALPSNVVDFKLPKKPKVREKEEQPFQKKYAVIPARAIHDPAITHGMLKVLLALCSYTNRAGITWVSQKRLAQDFKVSRQSITRQLTKLRDLGYVTIASKGFRGERSNTLQVIFDPSVTAEDAVAITSSIEDTRSPTMKQNDAKLAADGLPDLSPEQIRANKIRLAEMLSGLNMNGNIKHSQPRPIGEIMGNKKTVHRQHQEVANEQPPIGNQKGSHRQPHRQPPEVAQKIEVEGNRRLFIKIIERELKVTLNNELTMKLIDSGITDNELCATCQTLLSKQQAEGLGIPQGEELLLALLTISADQL